MRSALCCTGSRVKGPRGFTLVEILVAIAIVAVVLSTVYAAFSGTFRISRSASDSDKVYGMMRVTADRMLQDIESLSFRKGSYEITLTGGDAGDETRVLTFVSSAGLSYVDGAAAANARVRYYLTKEKEDSSLTLWRSDTAFVSSPRQEAAPKGFMICGGIKSLRYTLFDSAGNAHETWDSASRSGSDRAPVSVLVNIEFLNGEKSGGETYKFMTRVAIPARS